MEDVPLSDQYTADSLQVLEGLDAVRKRPGMYIGSTDSRGLLLLAAEIRDNAVDEALGGHADHIVMTLHDDGSVSVSDNGRGIPTGVNAKMGITGVEAVFTKLHAGGKFGGGGYAISGGLHGVGASVVNALSTKVEVEVDQGGKTHAMTFHNGVAGTLDAKGNFKEDHKLRVVGKIPKEQHGSRVRYWPNMDIFLPGSEFDVEAAYDRLRQTAFLVPGLTLEMRDERVEGKHTVEVFHYDGGSKDFVEFLAADRPLSDTLLLKGEGTFTERVPMLQDGKQTLVNVERSVEVDVAIRWGIGYDTTAMSFVNIVTTPKGGTHVKGFEAGLLKAINEQLKTQRVLKASDDNVIRDDALEGVTAVVTVRLPEPQFEGQTKETLGTRDVAPIVTKVVFDQLSEYFKGKTTKAEGRRVLDKIAAAAKTRLAARELKETKRRKNALESSSMPAKLVDCRSENVDEAELFIVEGDSALGTFKQGRDSNFQAALPIRGKILNTMRVTEKQMLSNSECAAIIQVLGAGSGRSFDLDSLRYGKLCLLTDADVDGAHIRCLLLTLVFKYLRPMLESGRVYATVPPLHRVELKGARGDDRYIYTYSDLEYAEVLKRLEKQGKEIKSTQRYKGLGEMDAEQLWETTLDPERRRLRRVQMDEAEAALTMMELCMGPDVPPRYDFIYARGGELDANLIDA
jgi:DNA gyrase subunit B